VQYRRGLILASFTVNSPKQALMKTILISTDFTDSGHNALQYAAAFAESIKATKLILYATYAAPPVTTTDMSFSFVETEGLLKLNEDELAKSKDKIKAYLPENIEIETRTDYGTPEQTIDNAVHETNSDLIVTSIENMSALEEALAGNGAVQMMHHTQTPVLMVPPEATWKPVQNIVWACDYKDLDKTTPVWNIKPLLQATGAHLHVIHNDPEHKQSDDAIANYQQTIRDWFPDTQISFALLDNKVLNEAVNEYVTTNNIDLILAVPKKHGWLEGLFSSSHSKQLAFHAHVPIVCVQAVK
jgi:nucleotide-binding universal stress UspA family protein